MAKVATVNDLQGNNIIVFTANTITCDDSQCMTIDMFNVYKEEITSYDIELTIKVQGSIYMGFGDNPRSYTDTCFIPANGLYSSFYNLYPDGGGYSAYNSDDRNLMYGFKIRDNKWKIGQLASNTWFKKNGLSSFSFSRDSGTGIYYTPLVNISSPITLMSSRSTVGTGTTNIYESCYLEMNLPSTTGATNENWSQAYIYYNGTSYHSGYNNPQFAVQISIKNPFSLVIPSQYNIMSSTQITLDTANSSTDYNITTKVKTIKATFIVTNPVLYCPMDMSALASTTTTTSPMMTTTTTSPMMTTTTTSPMMSTTTSRSRSVVMSVSNEKTNNTSQQNDLDTVINNYINDVE